MRAKAERELTIELIMDEKEARWLKAYMQNTFQPDEPDTDTAMRIEIFNTIRDAIDDATQR